MTLVDAYGLVAFLAGERAARDVEEVLRAGDAAVPAVNLAEAVDVMLRVRRHRQASLDAALVPLLATSLSVVAVGATEARLGGALRARHYHRRSAPLSLADCLLIACSVSRGAALATSDPPLAVAARAEGVQVLPLPDSSGRRP